VLVQEAQEGFIKVNGKQTRFFVQKFILKSTKYYFKSFFIKVTTCIIVIHFANTHHGFQFLPSTSLTVRGGGVKLATLQLRGGASTYTLPRPP
jgi:hypothetical protein